MPNGPRGGGGWSDDPDWVRPVPRGEPVGRAPRRPPPDYDEGWVAPAGPRRRTAIHDPWSPRRRIGLPSGMPPPPVLLGGVMALLFAFLLGRCTAGGGNEVSTGTGTTSATAATTTTPFEITHVVAENETLAAIADQYGITINELAIANSIGDANRIFVGQVLKIPPKTPVTTTSTTLKKNKKKNN